MYRLSTVLLTLATIACVCGTANAGVFSLVDGNSQVDFNTASSANATNWFVDGQDQLFQQAFWLRVGSTGGETSLHALAIGVEGTSDTDFDGNADTLFVRYLGTVFTVEVRYGLTGGAAGSNVSDLSEEILITNTSGAALDFHFFQYSDFDLGATSGNDTVQILGGNTAQQSDPNGLVFSETVVTPNPTHHEVAPWPSTLASLNDGSPTTLNDSNGPITGDVTWAFQWDTTIGAGGSFLISKDKGLSPVPEPASLALWSLFGVAGLGYCGWRRKRTPR
jgi:hypothetical protein